jgi:carbonic anhydrase
MSQSKITSPINIEATTKECTNTCFYSFNYGNSSCKISNEGDHLKFSYDATDSTVIYNDTNYTVQDIRLYKPSLNEYYGSHVDAELIIQHVGHGSNNLLVCIPIQTSNDTSSSETLFNNLIPYAPVNGNPPVSVNINNYNLNYIVPRGAYYSYTGTLPYDNLNGTYNIIVFDYSKVKANMSQKNMSTMSTLITNATTSSTYKLNNDYNINNLYYNAAGTTDDSLITGDDIYIDCKPTGSTESDSTHITTDDATTSDSGLGFNAKEIFSNPYFDVLLGIIGFLIVLKGGEYVYKKYITKKH